jgi:hypothetical protein
MLKRGRSWECSGGSRPSQYSPDEDSLHFTRLRRRLSAQCTVPAAARARGRTGGRPTVKTPAKLAIARQLYTSGEQTVAAIAATLGSAAPRSTAISGPPARSTVRIGRAAKTCDLCRVNLGRPAHQPRGAERCITSPQASGAVRRCAVLRREVARGPTSGKSLARRPLHSTLERVFRYATGHADRRHKGAARRQDYRRWAVGRCALLGSHDVGIFISIGASSPTPSSSSAARKTGAR